MPIVAFECSAGHVSEVIFQTVRLVEEAALESVVCAAEVKGRPCRRKARKRPTTAGCKVVFGEAFGHATKSDRAAWGKALAVQGWHNDEHREREKGGPIKPTRDRMF